MGAACTSAKRGSPKRKDADKMPGSIAQVGIAVGNDRQVTHEQYRETEVRAPPPRPLSINTEVTTFARAEGEEGAPFWQGTNSNLPQSKKHTDEVTISMLKPWMRISIPVQVISLGVPAKVNKAAQTGPQNQQPRQASKGRQKFNQKQQQESAKSHEVEAIAVVGDSTGCINMLVVDQQIPLFQTTAEEGTAEQPNCFFLVNVHCRLTRSKHLRLEADHWSQIKPIDMETLIASSAQVDHVKANEAQSRLNNVITVNTSNDVSVSCLQQNQQRLSTLQQQSPPQQDQQRSAEKETQQSARGGIRPRNRSRSNNRQQQQQQQQQQSGNKSQVPPLSTGPLPMALPLANGNMRSQSKRRKNNNRNKRSRSRKNQNSGQPQPQGYHQSSFNLSNQRQQQPQRKRMTSIGPMNGPPLMILDVQNIAMRYGNSKNFACAGIKVAIEYWVSRGHQVLGFLPDYLLWRDKIVKQWQLLAQAQQDPTSVDQEALQQTLSKLHQLPDDVDYLLDLQQQGVLCGTPSQDYDDSYCLNYARSQCLKGQEAFIVSNDLFRDYVANFFKRKSQLIPDKAQVQQLVDLEKHWLREHVLSYTFIMGEFQPNPDSMLYDLMQHGLFYTQTNQVAPNVPNPEDQYQPRNGFGDARGENVPYAHPQHPLQYAQGQDQEDGDSYGQDSGDIEKAHMPANGAQYSSAQQEGTYDEEYYDEQEDSQEQQVSAFQVAGQPAQVAEPFPQLVFRQEFPPLGLEQVAEEQQQVLEQPQAQPQSYRRGAVQLTEENMQRLPEDHVPSTSLPYGYYRQQARQNQAQAAQQI